MRSGTELRKLYAGSYERQRQAIVTDLFGKYTQEAEQIMSSKIPAEQAEPVAECGGTGVIANKKQANDPRYSMSLTKDVRPGQINKSLKAFNLAETDREPYQQAISRLEQHEIDHLNTLIDEIMHRITTEKLPPQYIQALKQRIEKLKAERARIATGK